MRSPSWNLFCILKNQTYFNDTKCFYLQKYKTVLEQKYGKMHLLFIYHYHYHTSWANENNCLVFFTTLFNEKINCILFISLQHIRVNVTPSLKLMKAHESTNVRGKTFQRGEMWTITLSQVSIDKLLGEALCFFFSFWSPVTIQPDILWIDLHGNCWKIWFQRRAELWFISRKQIMCVSLIQRWYKFQLLCLWNLAVNN